MSLRWVVTVSLLAVLLPGCFFGGCGFSPQDATWTEPGLHQAIDGLVASGKATRQQAAGAPFNGSAFGLDGARLISISLAVSEPDADLASISMDPAGHVTAATWNTTPTSHVKDWAVRFASNVSALRGAALMAWADHLVGNGSAGKETVEQMRGDGTILHLRLWQYSATLTPVSLDAFAARLHATWGVRDPGRIDLGAAGWTLQLSVPTWSAQRGAAKLTTDSFDHAHYEESSGEMTNAVYAQRINATLAALGLPLPVGPLKVGGYIC